MPGVAACGRCGASTRLAALAIDVQPPRASARAKRWRRWLPSGSIGLLARSFGTMRGAFAERAEALPEGPLVPRLIVPGWPQFYLRQVKRGGVFLGLYLACLLVGMLLLGSTIGSIAVGLAMAVHFSSVIDILLTGGLGKRFVVHALIICAIILAVVYVPAGWLLSRFASPHRLLLSAAPFEAGDVILVNAQAYRWRDPRPGEVALYVTPGVRFVPQTTVERNVQYAIAGQRVDRILAGPGQRVAVQDGVIAIDGRTVPLLPLNPRRMPATLSLQVPEHCYLILPTTALEDRFDLAALDWEAASLVPRQNLLGKVYLRHYPMRRFWWVR